MKGKTMRIATVLVTLLMVASVLPLIPGPTEAALILPYNQYGQVIQNSFAVPLNADTRVSAWIDGVEFGFDFTSEDPADLGQWKYNVDTFGFDTSDTITKIGGQGDGSGPVTPDDAIVYLLDDLGATAQRYYYHNGAYRNFDSGNSLDFDMRFFHAFGGENQPDFGVKIAGISMGNPVDGVWVYVPLGYQATFETDIGNSKWSFRIPNGPGGSGFDLDFVFFPANDPTGWVNLGTTYGAPFDGLYFFNTTSIIPGLMTSAGAIKLQWSASGSKVVAHDRVEWGNSDVITADGATNDNYVNTTHPDAAGMSTGQMLFRIDNSSTGDSNDSAVDFTLTSYNTCWGDGGATCGGAPTPPARPVWNLQIRASGADVVLSWTDDTNNPEDQFNVYRSTDRFSLGAVIAVTAQDATGYTDSGANSTVPASGYWYVVRGENAANGENATDSSQTFIYPVTLTRNVLPTSSQNAIAIPFCDGDGSLRYADTAAVRDDINWHVGAGAAAGTHVKQYAKWAMSSQALGSIYNNPFGVFWSGNFVLSGQDSLLINVEAGIVGSDDWQATGSSCGMPTAGVEEVFAANAVGASDSYLAVSFGTGLLDTMAFVTDLNTQNPNGYVCLVSPNDDCYVKQVASWDTSSQALGSIYNNPFGTFWSGIYNLDPGTPMIISVTSPASDTWSYFTSAANPPLTGSPP